MKHLLKGFKKVSEDDECTVFEHPNGHSMKVAKKGLGKDMQKQLSDLPAYASGGFIGDSDRMKSEEKDKKKSKQDDAPPSLSYPGKKIPYGYADGGMAGLHEDYSRKVKQAYFKEGFTGKKTKNLNDKEREQLERDVSKHLGGRAVDLRLPPGMAFGADVEGDNSNVGNPMDLLQPQDSLNDFGLPSMQAQSTPTFSQDSFSQPAPEMESPDPVNMQFQQASPESPQPLPQMGSASQAGMNQAISGIQGQADAQSMAAKQQAAVAQKQSQEFDKLIAHGHELDAKFNQEHDAAMQDYNNGHIDPSRYMSSKGVAEQALTALGLIMGGLGGGMTGHGGNMALDFLNKNIDRDIEAQKFEMHKKQNIMAAMRDHYGDERTAMLTTKAFMLDKYAADMAKIAAKSSDPMAQARAQQAIGQLRMQAGATLDEAKKREFVKSATAQGLMTPEQAITSLPKEQQSKAYEEIGKFRIAEKSRNMVNRTLDEAFKINSLGNRIANPIQSKNQLDSMEVNLLATLKPIFNNFSESDKEQAMANMPKLTDNQQTLQRKKMNMQQLIDVNTSTPTLDAFGISLPKSMNIQQSNRKPRR